MPPHLAARAPLRVPALCAGLAARRTDQAGAGPDILGGRKHADPREVGRAGRIGGVEVVAPPITEAVDQYLADAKARGLTASTLKKYRNVLENHLLGFCQKHGFRELRQLRVEALRQLREGWTLAPRT